MHRLVYLARPVDYLVDMSDPALDWMLEKVKVLLRQEGVATYDPGAAFQVGDGQLPGVEINRVNHQAQRWATGTVSFYPPGVPTIGVTVETYKATQSWAMPCAIIGATNSWVLADLPTMPWDETAPGLAVDLILASAPARAEDRKQLLPVSVDPTGKMPTRAYPDDAGLDLYVSETTSVAPGQFVDIHCGVSVAMEPHTWGMIVGRSSTLRTRGLMVTQGIIDPGFRGELYAGVWNLGRNEAIVARGERLAQLILMSNTTAMYQPAEVEKLPGSDRGTNGFGSSGA